MVFSSIIFLWVLLPCILLLYYVSPKPFKNGILTVFSLFFYAWGEPAVCGAHDFFGSAQLRFRASGGEIREKEMAFGALRDAQSSDPRLF